MSIAFSLDILWKYTEGEHNGRINRNRNLYNPKADIWRKLSHTLIEDSRDRWSIEDAGTYFPIWFNTLIHYAEETKDTDFFQHPVTQYYFRYLRELISPMGVIPDYGDGRWGSCWGLLLSCLEAGVAAYQDGEMKAAAHRLFHAMSALDNGLSVLSLKGIHGLVDSCLWADDGVMEIQKERESREVLEDVVGKKIVFEKNGNYLLTNYRDEGRFAWLQRNYLRNTIPVEPEKAHHGHSDENSIVCLISNGCVLLHDGGYRDCISEKRAYRSDYYHNRVILRNYSASKFSATMTFAAPSKTCFCSVDIFS